MGNWKKIIRDPIHDIISFKDNDCDNLLQKLIETKEFQRLRRIKQLGTTDLVFPSANHNRFSHSLGTMHVARLMLERFEDTGVTITYEIRMVVLASALLHDIGHGPYSHAFEKIVEVKHEKRSMEIILDASTEVNYCLEKVDLELPKTVASFLDSDPAASDGNKFNVPSYFKRIISSQLDADRFDYLLRDSYHTGTDYGRFDLRWLLENLRINSEQQLIFLDKKAFSVAEEYVYARYHMYKTVYFHKASRAAEVMLNSLFQRYKELLNSTTDKKEKKKIVPDCPTNVFAAFSGKMKLGEFLLLDDFSFSEFFKASLKSNDNTLKVLGYGLLNRKLFKCIELHNPSVAKLQVFLSKHRKALKDYGLEFEEAALTDEPSNIPYIFFEPADEEVMTQILVKDIEGKHRCISSQSDSIKNLKKFKLSRVYFPEELKDKITQLEEEVFNS